MNAIKCTSVFIRDPEHKLDKMNDSELNEIIKSQSDKKQKDNKEENKKQDIEFIKPTDKFNIINDKTFEITFSQSIF